ncbi:MAG: lipocalin family protein [Bacteroidota bacterium]
MRHGLFFILLLFVMHSAYCQSNSIVGEWHFVKVESTNEMSEGKRMMMTKIFGDMKLVLNEDRSFSSRITRKAEQGTYAINDNVIEMESFEGYIVSYPYVFQDNDTLKLEMKENEYIVLGRATSDSEVFENVEKKSIDYVKIDSSMLLDKKWLFEKKIIVSQEGDSTQLSGRLFEDDYFIFNPDGSFDGIKLKVNVSGSWRLNEDQSRLIQEFEEGDSVQLIWYVVFLSSETLVLKRGQLDEKWYYKME